MVCRISSNEFESEPDDEGLDEPHDIKMANQHMENWVSLEYIVATVKRLSKLSRSENELTGDLASIGLSQIGEFCESVYLSIVTALEKQRRTNPNFED